MFIQKKNKKHLAFTSMEPNDIPKLNTISGFAPYFQTASLKRKLILKLQFLVITSTERLPKMCSFCPSASIWNLQRTD